jgi:hypothetical protein
MRSSESSREAAKYIDQDKKTRIVKRETAEQIVTDIVGWAEAATTSVQTMDIETNAFPSSPYLHFKRKRTSFSAKPLQIPWRVFRRFTKSTRFSRSRGRNPCFSPRNMTPTRPGNVDTLAAFLP